MNFVYTYIGLYPIFKQLIEEEGLRVKSKVKLLRTGIFENKRD